MAAVAERKPRRMSPEQRREDLIAATLSLLTRVPPHLVTPAEVVAEAGVSRALFYRYFSSIDELFLVALARVTEGLTAQLLPPEDEPLTGQLRHAVHEFFGFAKTFRGPTIALLSRGPIVSAPQAYALVDEVRTNMIAVMVERAGVGDRSPYLELTLRSWIGVMELAVLTWLTDAAEQRALPRHELEDWLVDQLRAGLEATAKYDAAAAAFLAALG